MEHRIVIARALPDFAIEIEWDCGKKARVDLSAFVADGEVSAPLRDPTYFVRGLRIEGGGDWIAWPNGVDMDADALWYQAHPDHWAQDHDPNVAPATQSARS